MTAAAAKATIMAFGVVIVFLMGLTIPINETECNYDFHICSKNCDLGDGVEL